MGKDLLKLALLAACSAHAADVSLMWSPGVGGGATGYKIYTGTASRTYTRIDDAKGALEYTVTGLTDGKTYYFAATAYNATGESGYSNEVSSKTAIPPAIPGLPWTESTPFVAGAWVRNYILQSDKPFKVTWMMSAGTGNVTLQGAALSLPATVLAPSGNSLATAASLTAEGGIDWIAWGDTNRKTGTPKLGTYTLVGTGTATVYADSPRSMMWTDGTPKAVATSRSGIYVSGIGRGFAITSPPGTLILHVGGWNSGGTLKAETVLGAPGALKLK